VSIPPAQAQTIWSAFDDFYVSVPATGGNGDYTRSTWIANAGTVNYDTGLTNPNSWGYAGGNFNGFGNPTSVGTYVGTVDGNFYPLTSGGTYAGSGVSFNLGGSGADQAFWIGYNATYGGALIGKYTKEWFDGSPNYANNPGGVNNKYLWVQAVGLSTGTDGLGSMVTWTAPSAGTYYFTGSYVNGNYGYSTDFAIVDSTGATLLNKVTLAPSSSASDYSFMRTLSAGDVVQYQVGTPAVANQGSPLGLAANVTAANWNAYRDFYLAPTASGWTGATTPGLMGGAWGYYDANVNGSGYPAQIGSFFTTDGSGTGSQSLYKFSTNSPLGSATLVGASGWADTGGAGFPYYADTYGWGSSLGRYDTPWFSGAPQATNRIWMQAGYLNGPGVEGIAPVLSWTAPASGYYTIDGSWVVANQTGGGASLAIADNAGLTYDRYAAAMGSTNPFTYTKYYAAGTVIQFQVGSDFKTGAPVGLAADVSGTGSSNSAYFVNTGMSATESSSLTAPGSLTKSGNGTLTLSANNTFSGALNAQAGLLNLNTTSGSAAGSVSSLSVASGATLLVSQNNQVNNSATVSLSGGTIRTGAGVSEVFGNLNVSSASFLDFGTTSYANANTISFGTYTPSALLTLQNFNFGSTLTFKSDLSSSINNNSLFAFQNGGIGSYSWDSGTSTFTITAIPEPSTYLAAAGLLGMMLWPSRRRLIKDATRILGLTPPMRDRLAASLKAFGHA
jgi:autotransporter-associated beta strand protein